MSAPAILQNPPSTARRASSPALVLAAILTTQLMLVLDATIVNVALPDIQTALGFTPTGLSWVLNAYTLAFGGLLLLGARVGDLLGRRRMLLVGISVFALASFAGGFAQSSSQLLAARTIQGVGAALAAPSGLALLVGRFPEGRERARALGYFSAVSVGGAAVGLIAGGILTEYVSWRWVLFVNVPIAAALVVVARIALDETPRHPGRFDLAGAITATIGMTSVVYGFVRAASDGWSDNQTVVAFVAGAVLLASFVVIELRAASPITPLRLFVNRTRASALVGRVLLVAAMFGMFFYLTQILQDVYGYTPLVAGLAFLPLTVMLFVASRLSASLMERVGMRALMVGGLTISTVGVLMLTRLTTESGYGSVLLPLLLFGLGNGLAFVPLTAAGLVGVEPRDAGAASGLVNVAQQVGGSVGLAVLVTIGASATRHASPVGATPLAQAQHAFVSGADRAFLVSALLLAVTVVMLAIATPSLRSERIRRLAAAIDELDEELEVAEAVEIA